MIGIMTENINTDTSSEMPETQRASDATHARIEAENRKEQRHKLVRFLRFALSVLGATIAVYITVLAILFLMGWTAAPSPFAKSVAEESAQSTNIDDDLIDVSTWSDEELAAQMCMLIVDSSAARELKEWAGKGVGALVLDGDSPSTSLKRDIELAQANVPNSVQVFIVTDTEGGSKNPLEALCGPLHSAEEMGTWKLAEIERATEIHGSKLNELGVNMVLGPVADLGHENGALTKAKRTFAANHDEVADCAQAWSSGMNKAGIATVSKHWPGIGGFAEINKVVTAYNAWPAIQKSDARAFRITDESNTNAILVGHVIVPDMTEKETPTSISVEAYTYLRESAGDSTILLADDLRVLVKSGISQSIEEAIIASIAAGADMYLYQGSDPKDTKVIKELAAAIGSGTISRKSAEEKVERILRMKSAMDLSPEIKSAHTEAD